MNSLNTLTGGRKIMNMAKVGTVVQFKSDEAKFVTVRKQRGIGLFRYTLCEYQGKAKRNSSRHSFAFDIPAIIVHPLFSVGELAGKLADKVLRLSLLTTHTIQVSLSPPFPSALISLPRNHTPKIRLSTRQYSRHHAFDMAEIIYLKQ